MSSAVSSTSLLVLTVFNLVVLSVLTIQVFLKLKEKKEDLRLAKGLQLLQNKISILQDRSDKTDHQVQKIVQVIDRKSADIQTNMALIDSKTGHVEAALIRATEISKMLTHQNPQGAMADAQKTNLHVQAAKLANKGFSKEQIMGKVDLNPSEIDFIFKVNRDQLQFAEDQLPGWVGESATAADTTQAQNLDQNILAAFGNLIKAQKETKTTSNTGSNYTVAATSQLQTGSGFMSAPSMQMHAPAPPAQPVQTMVTPTLTTAEVNRAYITTAAASLITPAAATQTTSGKNVETIKPYIFKKITTN